MNKVRFGVVGIGNQGRYYSNLLADGKITNGVLSAVCDINPNKLKLCDEKFPDAKQFEDYKEMVKSGLVDAVLVETPHYIHPEIAEFCLQAGIHVLCDKPAGVYTKQVKELNSCAEKSSAIFGMMFNQRTNCLYRKMHELIKNGEIGEIQRVTWIITDWYRTQKYYDSGSWRATWKGEGGGVLINQCPHQIDLLQWILGKMPKSVRGFCQYGRWHNIEVEDEVTAFLEFDGGATGVFITTTGEGPGTNRFEITGSKGKLLCENQKLKFYKNDKDALENIKTSQESFGLPKYEIIEPETDGENRQHEGILNNFANAILGIEPLFVDGKEGIKMVEIMNAIELSGWQDGKKVSLPVDESLYLDYLNQHIKNSATKSGNDDAVETSLNFGTANNVKY